jgi:methanogenesis imperfect marker protein 11
MITGLKIRTNEFLGNQEYFRHRYLKSQWRSMALVGQDPDAIETVSRCPTWFASLASSAMPFLRGGGLGGASNLFHPMANSFFGDLLVTQFKPGQTDAKLVPSYTPLAVTAVKRLDDRAVITWKGIGGGPDIIRNMASGALACSERPLNPHGRAFDVAYPLYSKMVIGVDDTDSSVKGATFNTALQLASILARSSKDYNFLRLTLSLNWPANPAKTTNNASSALVFAVTPGKEELLVRDFERLVRKYTVSKETGMVVMNRIRAPEVLKAYARKVKRQQVTVSEAFQAAKDAGVRAIPITGERGLIGALSCVGLVDDTEEAVTPVADCAPAA